MNNALRHAKRIIIAVVGVTIIAIGVCMIVLPGPAFVVIPLGLGVLATEFAWARRLLKKVKQHIRENAAKLKKNSNSEHQ
jgi:uncharacterized protein (TIGR02611 family)